jgi:hypothetical protein
VSEEVNRSEVGYGSVVGRYASCCAMSHLKVYSLGASGNTLDEAEGVVLLVE